MKYNPLKIEKKWQKKWETSKVFEIKELVSHKKKKEYLLNMFPYPSAVGLHVGHVLGWTSSDVLARAHRMQGKHVLYPMGFDAFGLPAENFAIKTKVHPKKTTRDAIKNFTSQLKSLGISCNWKRVISTAEPEYYKWTQWFFLQLLKKKLAYKKKAPVNWCNSCQTVLAREQVINGKCERCKNQVVQKELEQWFFKITAYAEKLLKDLEPLDWPHSIKEAQRNWIGRKEGVRIKFPIKKSSESIDVFTTRPDTLYGVTCLVLAPEHPLIEKLLNQVENRNQVEIYIKNAAEKTELERTDLAKEKTGTPLKGIEVINPANNEPVPVWIADYVIKTYGTGAVMAVPSHDERDYEFARTHNLPIRQVIVKKNTPTRSYLMGGEDISDKDLEEIGIKIVEKKPNGNRNLEIPENRTSEYEELINSKLTPGFWNEYVGKEIVFIFKYKTGRIERYVLSKETESHIDKLSAQFNGETWKKSCVWKWLAENKWYTDLIVHNEAGSLVNSEKWNGMDSEKAKETITDLVQGKRQVEYRLHDWLISRQRYWGAPIPVIYCEKCGMLPVPEKDLPVILPHDVDFLPHGESPLTRSKSFHKVTCPKCGNKSGVRREYDTMDTFVDSSWYFLRYTDPKNKKKFAESAKIHYWHPIDWYIGGAEHAVLHLLYARFFTKALSDMKLLKFREPFLRLRTHGVILGEDGQKMSKSIGNVINPDEVLKYVGADTLRMYEMFMGPFEDTKPWSSESIMGVRRFLDRVWNISEKQLAKGSGMRALVHKSIKKAKEDIDSFKFNTAVSQLMILMNDFDKNSPSKPEWEAFTIILSPFVPHLAEELWHKIGNKGGLKKAVWPKYDESKMKEKKYSLVIQVNGKVRGVLELEGEVTKEHAFSLATKNARVSLHLEGKTTKQLIFIPRKILNIVVE